MSESFFFICQRSKTLHNFNLVSLRGKFWNILWPDLARIDKELEELSINPKDTEISDEDW